jgi:hypothetical protein
MNYTVMAFVDNKWQSIKGKKSLCEAKLLVRELQNRGIHAMKVEGEYESKVKKNKKAIS